MLRTIWEYFFPSAIEDPQSLNLSTLRTFKLNKILSEDTKTGSIYILGTMRNEDTIIHIQRTTLTNDTALSLINGGMESLNVFLDNRPYFSAHGTSSQIRTSTPDIQLKIIWPATSTHIRKYSKQELKMVNETPEMYEKIVLPYIDSFPPERLEWVYNILNGKKEAERILYNDPDEENGFMILPDLKWDQTSMSALYLTVLVRTRKIKSLRDLTKSHLSLLRDIKLKTFETVLKQFGVEGNKLRLFVHYQPSYYHFHVHVVHLHHETLGGMTVGQAHMLDDLIALLEISPDDSPSILAQMTFTYALGVEHGLYAGFLAYASTT